MFIFARETLIRIPASGTPFLSDFLPGVVLLCSGVVAL